MMPMMEIVAHRGLHEELPENSLAALAAAAEAGADFVEFDVRFTGDGHPVVTHYLECEKFCELSGYLFEYDLEAIRKAPLRGSSSSAPLYVSTLEEVVSALAGTVGLEIEIKGPEPEAARIVAEQLITFKEHWQSMEVTSYEPALLLAVSEICGDELICDLLFPRSESWMTGPIVSHLAAQKARLARARAVHLHPSQLVKETVKRIRDQGLEVHAWDVNDREAMALMRDLGISRLSTDRLREALAGTL